MLRIALLQSARGLSRTVTRSPSSIVRATRPQTFLQSRTPCLCLSPSRVRCYSAPAGLTKAEVESRIMDLLQKFDKVKDASKVTNNAHFSNDLGLDSLDTVEVVMAIEEEFSIEIPDKEADAIHSVDKAVEYIISHPDAH